MLQPDLRRRESGEVSLQIHSVRVGVLLYEAVNRNPLPPDQGCEVSDQEAHAGSYLDSDGEVEDDEPCQLSNRDIVRQPPGLGTEGFLP